VIGDVTKVDASSQHLKSYGWKGATGNVPASYLTGYLAGKYALAMGIKTAILDIGVNTCRKDSRIAAMLCGAVHAGLKIPHDSIVFPSEERYTGQITAEYAKKLKKNTKAYDKQFSGYKKLGTKPESLPTYFKATKKAIDEEHAAGSMKNKLKNRNKKNIASKSKPKTTTKKPTPKKPTTAKKPTTTKEPTTTKKTTSTTAKKPATTTKKPATTTKKTTSTTKKSTTTTKKPNTTKKATSSKSSTKSKK
jgi:large subunit ribosomal protein L18